ncbi:MAG: class I SAM-dependent methyltransferase [Acidobacteriales bacterium]|nr:class I SAM-dependent methyltransferase [Terriglobales bacterium]
MRDKALRFTKSFGNDTDVLADKVDRFRKALKVRSVLEDARVLPNRSVSLLDVGCSHGLMLDALAPYAGHCVGIDMDLFVAATMSESGIALVRGDAERLPFSDSSFEVVLCNHVYEHTDDAKRLVDEIARILKPTGVCYFAGPNKFDVMEPHYRLPLLSWLPRPVANLYVRLMKRGSGYPEKPLSWFALRRLLASSFELRDYTSAVVRDPARYAMEDLLPPHTVKHFAARAALALTPFLFPTFIYLLRKKNSDNPSK